MRIHQLLTRLTFAFAVTLLLQTSQPTAQAHHDPPASPAIIVRVKITMIELDQDNEAVTDNEVEVDFTVNHLKHGMETGEDHRIADDYEFGSGLVATDAGKEQIYSHPECTPMETVEVTITSLEEDDSPGVDDKLGSAPKLVFPVPGVQVADTTAAGGAAGSEGTGRVHVEVSAAPDPFSPLACEKVGGVVEILDSPKTDALHGTPPGGPVGPVAATALTGGIVALASGGWYLRRRFIRGREVL